MKARSKVFTDKAVNAMLAAIEIYNKPAFTYREDTFAVLAINAWELLLKARLLQINNNKTTCIQVYEKRRKPDGTLSKKNYVKCARSGNPMTIGMFRALDLLVSEHADTIDPLVRKNLEALTEIRDLWEIKHCQVTLPMNGCQGKARFYIVVRCDHAFCQACCTD